MRLLRLIFPWANTALLRSRLGKIKRIEPSREPSRERKRAVVRLLAALH